jgi:hypothetical protein
MKTIDATSRRVYRDALFDAVRSVWQHGAHGVWLVFTESFGIVFYSNTAQPNHSVIACGIAVLVLTIIGTFMHASAKQVLDMEAHQKSQHDHIENFAASLIKIKGVVNSIKNRLAKYPPTDDESAKVLGEITVISEWLLDVEERHARWKQL